MALRCEVCKHKDCPGDKYPCSECDRFSHDLFMDEQKQTWGDKIRNMTDEELAELLERVEIEGYRDSSITPKMENGYNMGILEWLKSEVKE